MSQSARLPTPLEEILREQILREGPLTFAGFMEAALYHPVHGYYTGERSPIGTGADYVTAPEHHPAFGLLVGRRALGIAARLDPEREFTVLEMGAGSGALAWGVLEAFRESGRSVGYRIVEPIPAWRKRQEARLAGFGVEWVPDLESVESFTGLFLSNELPDAFPVHRVVRRRGGLKELWVVVRNGRLAEAEGPVSTPEIEGYFQDLDLRPVEGRAVEVNLRLSEWARTVCRLLRRGSFLTIDYGDTADRLFAPGDPGRSCGRLRAYRGQAVASDPLADPGLQDLTCDVDFTTLVRVCRQEGFELEAFTTQKAFLMAMGWTELLRRAPAGTRRALSDLIDPRLMGGTRVLEMARWGP